MIDGKSNPPYEHPPGAGAGPSPPRKQFGCGGFVDPSSWRFTGGWIRRPFGRAWFGNPAP